MGGARCLEHCLSLSTPHPLRSFAASYFSFFQFSSLLCPLNEGRGCLQETAQGGSATDPLTGNKQPLKGSHYISLCPKPPP